MAKNQKPKAKIIGADSNVFVILGICTGALKRAGQKDEAKELAEKVFASSSYDEALSICLEYVDAE